MARMSILSQLFRQSAGYVLLLYFRYLSSPSMLLSLFSPSPSSPKLSYSRLFSSLLLRLLPLLLLLIESSSSRLFVVSRTPPVTFSMVPGHDISSRATSHNPPDLLNSTTLGCKFVKLAKVLLLNVAMDAFD